MVATRDERCAAMDAEELRAALERELGEGRVCRGEPLAAHTTFGIGGPADCFVVPRSLDEAVAAVRACRRMGAPVRVMGLGSDLLVADAGLRCAVVLLADNVSGVRVDGCVLTAEAGASNAQVAEVACAAGLSGYEFASGIPGTVGGAAIMNAGAYDGEFRDACVRVRCLAPSGEVVDVSAQEAAWSYRHSMMDAAGYVVLEAELHLRPDDPAAIRARMDDLARRRGEKQPLELPSAGSTFKRPEGCFVGPLVQKAGLQGFRVGGAQVSTKHAGFVVNAGGATAVDVRALIAHVQERVWALAGVRLEPEVRMWGFPDEEEPFRLGKAAEKSFPPVILSEAPQARSRRIPCGAKSAGNQPAERSPTP